MLLNADFSRPALVIPTEDDWVCSPESGVDRLMLDRIGDEVARATSLVRYAAGSSFREHLHAMGEEFLVLDGIFSDEHGDYPTGTYVRNPPGSRHSPASRDGCRILVKLRQFDPEDLEPVVIDTTDDGLWAGSSTLPLHRFDKEQVELQRLAAGQTLELVTGDGGVELLLVSGELTLDGQRLPAESWLRLPAGARRDLIANVSIALSGRNAGISLTREFAPAATALRPTGRRPATAAHRR